MDSSAYSYAILVQWGTRLPALLVYFAGVVAALTCWQTLRGPAKLTLVAMILLGVLALGTPVIMLALPQWQSDHHWTLEQMGFVSSAIGLALSLGQALGVGLLLAAVFVRRSPPPDNKPPHLPPPITTL